MVTTPLDLKYIYKRGRGLERRRSVNESARIPDLSGHMSEDFYRRKVETFARDCTSYKDALNLLETLYQSNRFDLLESCTQKVINDVIPTVESAELPNCMSCIDSADIGDINKDRLIEATKLYKSIDRITKNHHNLSKRFEMNLNGKSDKEKCYKICEMVCTYNLSKFIKFNIALEETAYLGYMNGNRMLDSVMVEHVSDYFLMMDDNTQSDIDHYRDAVKESKIISEGADANTKYLTCGIKKSPYWKDRLNEWKMDPNKKVNTLVELARENFGNINVLNTIMECINDFTTINQMEFDTMSIFNESSIAVSGTDAHNIMKVIEENTNITDVDGVVETMRTIWEAELNDEVYDDGTKKPQTFTSDEIDKFKLHNMITDAQNVGEFLNQLEKTSMKESPLKIGRIVAADDMDLNESTIVDHVDANGYLTMKLRSYVFEGVVDNIHNLLESSINCINNMLYNSNSVAYYNILENRFDISIRSRYKIILSEAQEEARGFSRSDKELICQIHECAEALDSMLESNIGFIANKLTDESYAASITAQEAGLVFEMLAPYLTEDVKTEFLELCRTEANPYYDYIKRTITPIKMESTEFDPSIDYTGLFEFSWDVMNINERKSLNEGVASNIKKAVGDIAKPFTKKKNDAKPEKVESKVPENKPEDTNNANDANAKKEEPEKEDPKKNQEQDQQSVKDTEKTDKAPESEDEKEKAPADNKGGEDTSKKAINSINDAKLAWQGVKAKMKGASAKEQEMSRDLDMEFNHLLRTLKSTYGNDHREEIITGEVNHSISKIIKIGIALAGVGVAAHTAVIPVIGAVALFARSKYTTLKEKKLILDEIDIELQVLDREIQRAEQSGSTKKYRQLLTIQKNIQRRRQEIYYELAKKGTRVPMQSTQGLRPRE